MLFSLNLIPGGSFFIETVCEHKNNSLTDVGIQSIPITIVSTYTMILENLKMFGRLLTKLDKSEIKILIKICMDACFDSLYIT